LHRVASGWAGLLGSLPCQVWSATFRL